MHCHASPQFLDTNLFVCHKIFSTLAAKRHFNLFELPYFFFISRKKIWKDFIGYLFAKKKNNKKVMISANSQKQSSTQAVSIDLTYRFHGREKNVPLCFLFLAFLYFRFHILYVLLSALIFQGQYFIKFCSGKYALFFFQILAL